MTRGRTNTAEARGGSSEEEAPRERILVLDSQKRVFSWGFGGYAEQKDEMVPGLVKLFDFPGRGAAQIYAGYTRSFAVSDTGGLFLWGATNTSRESTIYSKAVQDLCGWKISSLACGRSSIIVAVDENTISWGPSPTFGELGYGDHKPKSSMAVREVKTLMEQVRGGTPPLDAGGRACGPPIK